ncbi:MAG: hypothetical protein JO036_13050 [Candidatus Eremiobacteraeota bacterium]|nr:hypothetical protein [Candidatus Eremiobacteraeota bacterium]
MLLISRVLIGLCYGLAIGLAHKSILDILANSGGHFPFALYPFILGVLCLPMLVLARRTFISAAQVLIVCELGATIGMTVRNGCASLLDCGNVFLFMFVGPGLINAVGILLPAAALYGFLTRRW